MEGEKSKKEWVLVRVRVRFYRCSGRGHDCHFLGKEEHMDKGRNFR